jgi:hypothetical protein
MPVLKRRLTPNKQVNTMMVATDIGKNIKIINRMALPK